mgnify:CR=1 FL=1
MSRKPLQDSAVLIVGLARDCAAHLEFDVRRLSAAFAGAREVRWLVVESDSRDATPRQLERLGTGGRFHVRCLGALEPGIPSRAARIAHCRNVYLDAIRADPAFAHVDYVVVADLDGINTLVTRQGVESCWMRDDWDMVAANQRAPYYDVWALRHPVWSPNDCWAQVRWFTARGMDRQAALFACVYARMIPIAAHEPWIEVDSAFGGLAIYRREMFAAERDARYNGLTRDGAEICEHVPFHHTLRDEGARLFINPALINAGWTEHSAPLRP